MTEASAEILQGLHLRAAAAWPSFAVPAETFYRYALQRAAPEALASLHGEDLYLACACAQGAPEALAAFDRHLLAQLPAYLSNLRPTAAFIDEVRQALRVHLLVASADGIARIADYTGRGPLRRWVRVAAARTALNLRRGAGEAQAARGSDLDTALLSAPGVGVEMGYIKERYGALFRTALVDALAALAAPQRELLRLHFGEGQTMDQLAALLGLHRATAARRVQAAAQAAFTATRRLLKERLNLDAQEFESLVTLLRSQLDLSISRVLGPTRSHPSDR